MRHPEGKDVVGPPRRNDSQWLTDACEEKLRACVAAGNVVHVHGPGKMFKPDRLAEIIEIHWDKDWVKTVQLFAPTPIKKIEGGTYAKVEGKRLFIVRLNKDNVDGCRVSFPVATNLDAEVLSESTSSSHVAATSVVSVGRRELISTLLGKGCLPDDLPRDTAVQILANGMLRANRILTIGAMVPVGGGKA